MLSLAILSGGAAQGLVGALSGEFAAASGYLIGGTFGAVGAMRAKLAAGEPADVVILTSTIIQELSAQGVVLAETIRDVGLVDTAIAVRSGETRPDVSSPDALRQALAASHAIYFPDPEQATAGIHFAGVLQRLGIAGETQARRRTFPNGATAMAALAACPDLRPIGCTQATEILATQGVDLVGPLPAGFDLSTMYTAAAVSGGRSLSAAKALIDLITAPKQGAARARCGFR